LSEKDVMREERARPVCWGTISLLVINGLVWLLQLGVYRRLPHFRFDDYFALSLDGLRHGYVWQLLTFQLMHGSWMHIILNSWAIYVFGRAVEMTIGWRRMLQLYFLSGVVGGLVQMLGTWLLPGLFGDAGVVGASAGGFGLIAAFATLYPDEILFLLLFFVIPIRMRAQTLLRLSVALSVFGVVQPWLAPKLPHYLGFADLFSNVAHAAHLGGIVTGCLFAGQLLRRYRRHAPPVLTTNVKSSLNINPAGD